MTTIKQIYSSLTLFVLLSSLIVPSTITTASASTWQQQISNTSGNLSDVHFIDANEGWVVGREVINGVPNGIVLHTTDGGTTWNLQATFPFMPGFAGALFSVDFLDSNNGYISGATTSFCETFAGGPGCFTIKRTTDGGQTWQDQDLNLAHFVTDIDFVDVNNGWLVSGDDEIRHTSNGGADGWPFQLGPNACCFPDLTAIKFHDVNNGWAVGGDPDIYKTTNGGTSWVSQVGNLSPSQQTAFFNELDVLDPNTVWIVGNNGIIVFSNDSGISWTTQTSGTTNNLNAIGMLDANNGWTVGNSGTILMTQDGGQSWQPEASGTSFNLNSISTVSSGDVWAVGDNGIILKRVSAPEVNIDIKPGSDPNSINTKSNGVIPVAILGSIELDVNNIDSTTLVFGPSETAPKTVSVEDVNNDGFDDLISHYKTQETGLAVGDTEACLKGSFLDQTTFESCDSVRIVK